MSFWKELSKRNVVKVGIAYAVAAWLIIHPVDIIFPILHLPEWSITLVTALLVIGFPFVLIFSWVYEVTPKGLRRTKEVPLSKSITQVTGKKLNLTNSSKSSASSITGTSSDGRTSVINWITAILSATDTPFG